MRHKKGKICNLNDELNFEIGYINGIVWNCQGFDRYNNIEYDLKNERIL